MISVIVPAYNEEDVISECLEPLAGQDCELIVVVGGSDSTGKIASKYGKVVKDTVNAGAGAARNLGAKAAKGDILLFTDADTVVPKDWVSQYKKVFEKKDVVAAGGVVKPRGGSFVDRIVFKINQDWLYLLASLFGFYQFSGNNCAYRKREFLAAGGFDEEMSMLEDTELALRIGGKKEFVASIFVYTSPRRMKAVGYARLWLKFVWEYVRWLVLGKKPKKPYFASARKAKS